MAAIHIVIAYNANGQDAPRVFVDQAAAFEAARGIELAGTQRAMVTPVVYRDETGKSARIARWVETVAEYVGAERRLIDAENSSPDYSES